MPVGDAYLTKTAVVDSATTFYPTGPIEDGGASVDEYELHKAPLGQGLALVLYVPSVAGTDTPTLVATFETDDNTSFSSAQTRLTGRAITAAGVYFLGYVAAWPEDYGRVKLVATGTNPVFGTVTAALTKGANSIRLT